MPLLFLHGINVRDEADDPRSNYTRNLTARNVLMQRYLLARLAQEDPRYAALKIVSPYWGKNGVRLRWNGATIPKVKALEDLGPERRDGLAAAGPTPRSDIEWQDLLRQGPGETPKAAPGAIKRAFLRDPERFIEAVFAPLIHEERALIVTPGAPAPDETPERVGVREALLLAAGHEVARDPDTVAAVRNAPTDDQVLGILKQRVQLRFEELAEEREAAEAANPALESQGGLEWLGALVQRAGEFFDRAGATAGRLTSLGVLQLLRDPASRGIARPLGDVFVYLKDPQRIVEGVLAEMDAALAAAPAGELLLVITHSMGGNIFYDIFTQFRTDLKVSTWVSVGGQVGAFEEMKLLRTSDPNIQTPAHLPLPSAGRLGRWLNVYDPADLLSFLCAPVFDGVKDLKFSTGAPVFDAHSAYFKRPSFYELVRSAMEG